MVNFVGEGTTKFYHLKCFFSKSAIFAKIGNILIFLSWKMSFQTFPNYQKQLELTDWSEESQLIVLRQRKMITPPLKLKTHACLPTSPPTRYLSLSMLPGFLRPVCMPACHPASQATWLFACLYIFSCDEQLKKWRCHSVRPCFHPFFSFSVLGVLSNPKVFKWCFIKM